MSASMCSAVLLFIVLLCMLPFTFYIFSLNMNSSQPRRGGIFVCSRLLLYIIIRYIAVSRSSLAVSPYYTCGIFHPLMHEWARMLINLLFFCSLSLVHLPSCSWAKRRGKATSGNAVGQDGRLHKGGFGLLQLLNIVKLMQAASRHLNISTEQ